VHQRTSVEHALREFLREIVRDELAQIVEALRRLESALSASNSTPLEYLGAEEAADIAGVTPDTVRAWVRRGDLPRHRAGRLVRIRRDELEAFLGRRSNGNDSGDDMTARVHSIVGKLCGGQ
jgi:excisionase family DNA binding protein